MNRTKAQQSSYFEGTPTLPPTRKNNLKRNRLEIPGEPSNDTKRQRTQLSDEDLDAYFFKSMENRLRLLIRTIVRRNDKKVDKDLKALKQKLSTAKKLPPGIITDTAKLAQTKYNDDKDLTLKRMRQFMEIASLNSNHTDINLVDNEDSAAVSEDSYRTYTVSLKKMIREDLDLSVKDLIMQKLQCTMIDATDYILCFSSVIQMMIISLKNNQFYMDGAVIGTHKVIGFDITTIVPSNFQTDSPKYTVTPLPMNVGNSPTFDAGFSQLFQDNHLSLVHSKYFGVRGTQQQTLNGHPVQNILFKVLEVEDIKKETLPVKNLPSSVTNLALEIYKTNFKNMWSDKNTINKLLDKLLTVLLRLHLAPERVSSRRQKMLDNTEKMKMKKKRYDNGIIVQTRFHRRLRE